MNQKLLLIITTFFFISILKAQENKDTIITINNDTILCQITLVNNYNIFYSYNPKRKKRISTYIPRSEVNYFAAHDKSIKIQEEETPPEPVESGFAEDNGIIYPAFLTSPPIYKGGQNDLHAYIEEYVRVYIRDMKVFQDNPAVVLFQVTIDSVGKVTNVLVYESAAQTGGFHYDCIYLENEIRTVIESMENWTPATIDGNNISTTVYIPLRFILDGGSIAIIPSKFLFTFKERE